MNIIRDASEFYASRIADQLQEKGAMLVPEDVCNAFSDGANFVLDSQANEITKLKEALREAVEHMDCCCGTEYSCSMCRFREKHAAIIEEVRK